MSDQDNVELVEVASARNTLEADLIVTILEDAGIPATIDNRYSQDDFAVPSKMLGFDEGVKVRVRKQDLEEARRVLEETHESARALDDGEPDLEERSDPEPDPDTE